MRATLRVDGLEEARQHLRSVEGGLLDPGEGLIVAADVIAEANVARIKKGIRPKLAPSTLRAKRRLGQPSTPLIGDGTLLRSLAPGGRNHVIKAFHDIVRVGTKDPEARWHQNGGKGRLPRRRVMTSGGKKVTQRAAEAYKDHLMQAAAGDRPQGLRSARGAA